MQNTPDNGSWSPGLVYFIEYNEKRQVRYGLNMSEQKKALLEKDI